MQGFSGTSKQFWIFRNNRAAFISQELQLA